MNLSDELERLGKLRKDGLLTEQEFAQAKSKLLQQENPPPSEGRGGGGGLRDMFDEGNSLGTALNRFITFKIVVGVVGLILFLIIFLTVFLPHFRAIDHAIPSFGPGGPHFP